MSFSALASEGNILATIFNKGRCDITRKIGRDISQISSSLIGLDEALQHLDIKLESEVARDVERVIGATWEKARDIIEKKWMHLENEGAMEYHLPRAETNASNIAGLWPRFPWGQELCAALGEAALWLRLLRQQSNHELVDEMDKKSYSIINGRLPILLGQLEEALRTSNPKQYALYRAEKKKASLEFEGKATQNPSDPEHGVVLHEETSKFDLHGKSEKREDSMSMRSLISATTAINNDEAHYETWVLNRTPAYKDERWWIYICWITIFTKYVQYETEYSVEALASHESEIERMMKSDGMVVGMDLKKMVHLMEDGGKEQILNLIRERENKTSGKELKTAWELVGLEERPIRGIFSMEASGGVEKKKKKWYKRLSRKSAKEGVEWVMVLKGQTTDRLKRVTPHVDLNPWKDSSEGNRKDNSGYKIEKKTMGIEETQKLLLVLTKYLFCSDKAGNNED